MLTSESRNEAKHHNALKLKRTKKTNNCNIHKGTLHNNDFKIYHQNIRGLSTKISEIYAHLYLEFPQILCFTEHHLKYSQIENLTITNYTMGTSYCRESIIMGGVCIYVHNSLAFGVINISELCTDKAMEACAIKCSFFSSIFCVLAIYRSPSGNFSLYITPLETIIKKISKPNLLMLVCGDFNINYLIDNNKKQQYNYMLQSFNLYSVVHVPTRITTTTQTLIDNIFIDITKFENYTILPVFNGLSEHDGQLLSLHQQELYCKSTSPNHKTTRIFNKFSLDEFKFRLCCEIWENVFNTEDSNIDNMFNTFANTYLQIFYACFRKRKSMSNFPLNNG
jgi:exonuclease III